MHHGLFGDLTAQELKLLKRMSKTIEFTRTKVPGLWGIIALSPV